MVIATLHAPLDAVYCLEVLVLRRTSEQMRCIAEHLIGTKGVMYGKLVLTAVRLGLPVGAVFFQVFSRATQESPATAAHREGPWSLSTMS